MSKSIRIINEGFMKKYMKEDLFDGLKREIKRTLDRYGYNTEVEGADEYITAAAEYIEMSRDYSSGDYSVEDWLKDTELNYPEDLAFMKVSVDECITEDVEKEVFHNDNGEDYDIIERSKSGKNALLNKGKQWVIAWNCPESNEGSWGQGHYFFDEESARKAWEDGYLTETLNDVDYDDFKSRIYNAISDVIYKYANKVYRDDVSKEQIENAIEWFETHFFDNEFEEGLNRLTEAGMSDEDRHDTEILRNIYKKIDGKQLTNKTLTPEEQELLKKYNLDAWGYRGNSKVVTDAGRKDVINSNELRRAWGRGSGNDKFNKINYADRARKIDDRDYAQTINRRKGWNQSFDDAEKELQQKELTKNVDRMKYALRNRKYHQSELNDAEKNLNNRLSNIDKEFTDTINKAKKSTDDDRSYNRRWQKHAQASIDRILDKHRVKECLNQLREAEISPEDKADSDLLRGIYRKILNRSNAALTPEEKAIIDKYNLKRTDRNFTDKDHKDYMFNKGDFESSWREPERASKINYADKARKLGKREYAKSINNYWGYGKSFQNKERARINQEMGQDVDDMKTALHNRNYHRDNADRADVEYNTAVLKAAKDRDAKIQQAHQSSKNQIEYHKQSLDQANKDVKKLLNKEESLKEARIDKDEARVVSTGLSGEINNDILRSVIGQMSDGIWENSPGMEGYWMGADIDSDCNIVVDNNMYIKSWKDYIKNPYYNMTDDAIRRYFANKIKYICQEYLNDNNLNPYKEWKPDSDKECDYLGHGRNISIADAYAAYKALK